MSRILSWVRRYCGWHVFGEVTETLTVDGSGSPTLHLPTLRVTAIDAVAEDSWDGGQIFSHDLEDQVDFTWSSTGVVEKRAGSWTCERRGVRVTFTHGFETADALLGVVVAAAVRHAGAPDGNALARVGQISYQSSSAGAVGGSAFLQTEYAVLDAYRLNQEV